MFKKISEKLKWLFTMKLIKKSIKFTKVYGNVLQTKPLIFISKHWSTFGNNTALGF